MNTLYYITAYHWKGNEWWRFAVSAPTEEAAIKEVTDGYSDVRFDRINATPLCTTTETVFKEV